jgi:hypothetical protein
VIYRGTRDGHNPKINADLAICGQYFLAAIRAGARTKSNQAACLLGLKGFASILEVVHKLNISAHQKKMKTAAQALQSFFSSRFSGTDSLSLARLWLCWPQVLGPELAELARPLGHKERVLILGVEDSVVMQELSYYQQDILDNVEDFLGWRPFDKVKLELLNNRTCLDKIGLEQPRKPKAPTAGLLQEQKAELDLDPATPVGSCYQAYKRMLSELGLLSSQSNNQDLNS